MTREMAEEKLRDQVVGSFLLRIGRSTTSLVISVKSSNTEINHIDRNENLNLCHLVQNPKLKYCGIHNPQTHEIEFMNTKDVLGLLSEQKPYDRRSAADERYKNFEQVFPPEDNSISTATDEFSSNSDDPQSDGQTQIGYGDWETIFFSSQNERNTRIIQFRVGNFMIPINESKTVMDFFLKLAQYFPGELKELRDKYHNLINQNEQLSDVPLNSAFLTLGSYQFRLKEQKALPETLSSFFSY